MHLQRDDALRPTLTGEILDYGAASGSAPTGPPIDPLVIEWDPPGVARRTYACKVTDEVFLRLDDELRAPLKVLEYAGTSPSEAIQRAILEAAASLRDKKAFELRWLSSKRTKWIAAKCEK